MTAIGEGEVEGDTDLHLLGDSGVGDLIDTANGLGSPPVADAGVDIVASGGEVIELDGSASTDPDGDELTYQWALTTLPTSSYATIINADTADQADFYADVEGVYIATLVVFDGSFSASDEVQITISQPNEAPVASAGADQYVTVGDTVQLNGSSSYDSDIDELGFTWFMATRPSGSSASLSDPGGPMPRFTADAPGTYEIELIVDDGEFESAPDSVRVIAQEESSGDCLSCGAAEHALRGRLSSGSAAGFSGLGLLALLGLLVQRRR